MNNDIISPFGTASQIPKSKVQHSYSDNEINSVLEYLNDAKKQKIIRMKFMPTIKAFLQQNQVQIMFYVNKHNQRNEKKLTFEHIIQLAEGWPMDDISILVKKVQKNQVMGLVHKLLSI